MKPRTDTPEMTRFNDALRQVMHVSKDELKSLLKNEKAIEATRQKRGPKPSVSDPASRDKD
jgi:hypothetical protein